MTFNPANESVTLSEGSDIQLGANDSFWIKRLFLSFFQAYFKQHRKYTWTSGQDTNIIITDKYGLDLNIAHKKPAIVLSRGSMRWGNVSIGQYKTRDLFSNNATFTDLNFCSITLNCMAKNGIVCEELALTVRNLLTANRQQLLSKGLHKILNISVGDERTLTTDSDIELTVVPVNIEVAMQTTLEYLTDFYTISVQIDFNDTDYGAYSGMVSYVSSLPMQLYENRDFTVFASGITFASGYAPPVGATLYLRYIDTVLLEEQSETVISGIDGSNLTFYTTQNIYGYSPLLADILVSGIVINND